MHVHYLVFQTSLMKIWRHSDLQRGVAPFSFDSSEELCCIGHTHSTFLGCNSYSPSSITLLLHVSIGSDRVQSPITAPSCLAWSQPGPQCCSEPPIWDVSSTEPGTSCRTKEVLSHEGMMAPLHHGKGTEMTKFPVGWTPRARELISSTSPQAKERVPSTHII